MATKSYTSGKIDRVQLEDLKESEEVIGQIYPVLKNRRGEIVDGFHRKRVNPAWKEVNVPIDSGIATIRLRIHLNVIRRDVERSEKEEWVSQARELLQAQGKKGTQKEIAEALGMARQWITKYDPQPDTYHTGERLPPHSNVLYSYNVWGFRDKSWRQLIVTDDPNQPDVESYHGKTPTFVIENLINLYQPKSVLDTMAGVGTTKYVCSQHNILCHQFDLYPFPKNDIKEGDAETIQLTEKYDLIFNHLPYLGMVQYGDHTNDLSNMKPAQFYQKLERIFARSRDLLQGKGIYAILVGDWRHKGHLEPITAKTIEIALNTGFVLKDSAIKLTGEMESKALQEYRAGKFGYLAQTYDTVLMFQREGS